METGQYFELNDNKAANTVFRQTFGASELCKKLERNQ